MGLFDRKFCSVCGEKIGLLGNRKLEDGNLCKKCAAKLSPFFSERRSSTVAEIKEQLDYREANRDAVAAFHTTLTLGRGTKVYVDEDAKLFMVTSASNVADANPDVMKLSDVTGCDFEIEENRREVYREVKNADGSTKRESYSPRRFHYGYDFKIAIHVNNPYFNEIKFELNSSQVNVDWREDHVVGGMLRPAPVVGHSLEGNVNPPPVEVRRGNGTYAEYKQMGEQIRSTLLQTRDELRAAAATAAQPKAPVTCPYCGAQVVPDANGRCEYCGGALNG